MRASGDLCRCSASDVWAGAAAGGEPGAGGGPVSGNDDGGVPEPRIVSGRGAAGGVGEADCRFQVLDVPRSPWHRARLRLVSGSESEAQWVESLLPATPGPRAESVDLERALASLAPTARAVVWLFEVEGYSHEEIAQSFGRSVSFSKSQLGTGAREAAPVVRSACG